ncbi:GMC family oxidoreductase [Sphingomonas gei]|uniref:GMC family oxidoreductase n=1 Tax=Sphingomonas gei TaxID=1395960 RepID=A0A4S1XBL8_9SPHN|nr:GMC oxidoreductase [Sphingomonas gei]TGX53491.1 GMC family oxidoreductase [Sphingomonas gei]
MIESLHAVPDAIIECDVLIIGAGAAGITLASLLDDGHRDVVLAEGGGMAVDATAQSLFKSVQQRGTPFAAQEGRYRVFGGTTVAWTGRCAELDPIDFAERAWIPGSGWPITHAELAAFYPQAMRLCGFADGWEGVPTAADNDIPAELERFVWRFWHDGGGRYQNFGERFAADFRRSLRLRVLLDANLTRIEPAADRTDAHLRTADGARRTVRARQIVLCCGGIENARLLLNLAEDSPNLLAGVAPVIGRYFMQHPRAATARFALDRSQSKRLQRMFNRFRRAKGLEYEAGLSLSAATQARHGLANASAVFRYARRGWGLDSLIDVAAHPGDGLISGLRRLRGREPLLGPVTASLVVDLEQAPDFDSRITLARRRDSLGLRHAAIDWRVGAIEQRTSRFLTAAVHYWLRAGGLARPLALPGLESSGALEAGGMFESYHHLGATRMATSPRNGVVDTDLRIHGTQGLYVCGGSVMPTGGHVNPTLTIVALAARLAKHLGQS